MEERNLEPLLCKCGAPLEMSTIQDLTQPIRCRFCGSIYVVRERQNDALKIKQELKTWFEQLLVAGGSGGSSGSNNNLLHLTFNESLYPSLQRDVDQYLENLEDVLESPMVHLKPMIGFSDYQPNSLLVTIGQGDKQELKILFARVSARQVEEFAIMPTDRLKLKQLRLRIQSMIYYANIANQLAAPSPGSYKLIRENLAALQKDYQEYAQEIVGDTRYRSYLIALDARTRGDILLLDVFISALDERRDVTLEATLARLGRAIAELEKARQQAHTCMYNSLYTVPLEQGIQKDITVARVFEKVIACYETVARTRSVEFRRFYKRLTSYIYGLTQIQSASDLLWLLTSVHHLLKIRSGNAAVPALLDWSWLDPAIESNRSTSFFGLGGEKSEKMLQHYHPYWAATVNYTGIDGFFSKKGSICEGLILVDATSLNTPVGIFLPTGDPFLPAILRTSTDRHTYIALGKQMVALPALLCVDTAERSVKAFADQYLAEMNVTNIRMIHVVYLPAASIRYTSKRQSREIVKSSLKDINQNLGNVLMQTQQFLRAYGI
jgi:hypothetical protein